jgi:hypothetical protein
VANERPLWERQDWDSAASFAAFQKWLLQDLAEGEQRSLDAAYRLHVGRQSSAGGTRLRASATWRRWYHAEDGQGDAISGAKNWEDRAKAYDDYLADKRRRKWERRALEISEMAWERGLKLLEWSDEIMKLAPRFDGKKRLVTDPETGQKTVVQTLALRGSEGIQAAKVGVELLQLAAGVVAPGSQLPDGSQLTPVALMLVQPKPPQEDGDGSAS